jgi:hypothetical protein
MYNNFLSLLASFSFAHHRFSVHYLLGGRKVNLSSPQNRPKSTTYPSDFCQHLEFRKQHTNQGNPRGIRIIELFSLGPLEICQNSRKDNLSFKMTTPVVSEQNFSPQVPEPTNGPNIHTYIPRDDGSILVGGVIYRAVPPVVPATATVGANTAIGIVPVVTQSVPPPVPVVLSATALPNMVYSQPCLYSFPTYYESQQITC